MPDLESVGDAATGAVLARAVEPGAGEADDGHTHETKCLNCGAQLLGGFCHECGQRAHVHRSLKGFFHDLLHGVLHFEGKIWRTLPKLIGNPGDLTRRYIDGERARYVSPIALFLFSVFLMFAIFGMTGGSSGFTGIGLEDVNRVERRLEVALRETRELEAQRAQLVAAGRRADEVETKLRRLSAETALLRLMAQRGVAEVTMTPEQTEAAATGNWLDRAYVNAKRNPKLLIYKLKTNAYKFSWALIPLSVPFLWLLFPFSRRFRLYDHTVFVTYSLSFMTMLIIAALLLGTAGLGSIGSLAFLVPPIHMYLQLKGTYGLTRVGALWRTVLLVSFAFVAVAFFALLLLTLGVLD
jgi:hypothetical protein